MSSDLSVASNYRSYIDGSPTMTDLTSVTGRPWRDDRLQLPQCLHAYIAAVYNAHKLSRCKRAETDFSNHRRRRRFMVLISEQIKGRRLYYYIYMYTYTPRSPCILIKNQPHSASPARNTLTRARVPTRCKCIYTHCLCIQYYTSTQQCSGRCSGEGPYLKWEFRLSIRKRKSRDQLDTREDPTSILCSPAL